MAGTAADDSQLLQLNLALEAGRLGVWDWDREADAVTWSVEMERLAGVPSGSFGGTFEDFMAAVHPEDRDRVAATIERGLATGRHVVEHRFLHPDGTVVWIEGRGSARRDDAGDVVGLVGIAMDVTDRVRHRERLEAEQPVLSALDRISLQLNRERDRARLAETVVEVAAEALGADGAGLVRRPSVLHPWEVVAATAGADAASEEAARVVSDAAPRGAGPRVHEAPGALAVPVEWEPDLTELLVVLHHGAVPAGAARLLGGLGAHAATALENARLHEVARAKLAERTRVLAERDEVSRQLQRSLLPPDLPVIPGLDLAAGYLPMTQGIGGDFYDIFPLHDGSWGIVLGDVCGKGPAAAGITALARHTLRAAAMARHRPAEAVQVLNQAMTELAERTFCTVVDARLRPVDGRVCVEAAVAGHPPILVLRADGSLEQVGPTGHLVGMFDHIESGETSVELGPGDTCVLYTDGATDVRRDGEVFGDDRLADVVHGCRGMSAAATARSIELAVVDYQRGDISDDLAVVVLRVPESAV
ncbi:SpoIIE family protein phosphatase [Acidimicrobiia bacterium EGI L10123]|uniref:SpoIIE family protein phosphatase n=1 Tax=Salinilacustrithrix flava TaxID=2957203 RepID=UPI003D7C1BCB|nr:SpoIIE family protein phosphatase [Acidimicrobiia bacterium EGI L10123]